MQEVEDEAILSANSGNAPSEVGSRSTSLTSESEKSPANLDITLSPSVLMEAADSVLEQVDWCKVARNVGGQGTAIMYRTAFEDMLRSKIGKLRLQGKMYRSGRAMDVSSTRSSFIESDTDDYPSGDYRDNSSAGDSEETDEEDPERYGFCSDETDEESEEDEDNADD